MRAQARREAEERRFAMARKCALLFGEAYRENKC